MTLAEPIRRRIRNTRSIGIANNGNAEQFRTSTFGEILPGLHFEAVIDPRKPQSLQLHPRAGSRFYSASQIKRQGKIYVPANLTQGLAQGVRFPSPSVEFGSPAKLIGSMAEFFCNFGKTSGEDADLLTAFALSTWFIDCFRRAPCLHLTGSSTRVNLIMRLLACLCRRPLLLGHLDLAALSTLPKGLNPTLLIYAEKLTKNVARILDTSRNRNLAIPFGKSWIYAYGARVLFSDPTSVNASELRIHLASTADALPDLDDKTERTISADFQSQLLRYRMVHFETVQDSRFDCSSFNAGMQDCVQALLTPLVDCDPVRESVLPSLRSQNKEVAGAKFTDLDCLVVEAALAFCHDPSKKQFLVKEIADVVNAILVGRHEDREINAKTVGHTLRGLGLFAERISKGYRVVLSNGNSERIHRLAREYKVVSIENGARCDQCEPVDATRS